MKTFFPVCFLLLGLIFSTTASAQLAAGGGLAFGTGTDDLGLQIRGTYEITEAIVGEADIIIYFDGVPDASITEINLNGQYRLGEVMNTGDFDLYGLAGLNFYRFNFSSSVLPGFGGSFTEVGFNLGAGANFDISDLIGAYAEVKYALSAADQLVIAGGVLYRF